MDKIFRRIAYAMKKIRGAKSTLAANDYDTTCWGNDAKVTRGVLRGTLFLGLAFRRTP